MELINKVVVIFMQWLLSTGICIRGPVNQEGWYIQFWSSCAWNS